MTNQMFSIKVKGLIDDIKATCASYGLGNDGNEYKIITQMFLYKFVNDRFGHDYRAIAGSSKESKWESELDLMSDEAFAKLQVQMPPGGVVLERHQLISFLHNRQNEPDFSALLDTTLLDISEANSEVFSVLTANRSKIRLFDEVSIFVQDQGQRDQFCRALINSLISVSFEGFFSEKFDFFSDIFEYLIQDYNKDGGGKYAEYYTPHAVSKIISEIIVDKPSSSVTCYDPSAGSGTLLMNLAHVIGEERCSIFSQDISQKSSGLLRLNLVLNNLSHSIPNVVQGNTLINPYHKIDGHIKKFDFIVSNPPFKLDFSEYREELAADANNDKFFAGVPNVPKKDKDKMAIYLVFLQHILASLSETGRAAVVVPTGFLTGEGIRFAIRKRIIDNGWLQGIVSMPSNIFATTGTSVAVVFIDKSKAVTETILVDASKLGKTVKEGKNQKTELSGAESDLIVATVKNFHNLDGFSRLVPLAEITSNKYSLAPSQYFHIDDSTSRTDPETLNRQIEELSRKIQEDFELIGGLSPLVLESLEKIRRFTKYD